jgi:hypothetical protein
MRRQREEYGVSKTRQAACAMFVDRHASGLTVLSIAAPPAS